MIIRRLQSDDQFSAAGEQLKMKYIWKSLLDWKTWVGSTFLFYLAQRLLSIHEYFCIPVIIYVGCDAPLYAFSLFLPSIIAQVCCSPILLPMSC